MKKICILSLLSIFLFTIITGCKKQSAENPSTKMASPLPHGAPNGSITSKMIGVEGGIIQTQDGVISVQVPAGAVSAQTEFKITPISGTLPSSTGQAFRLEPENINFNKDVVITFQYSADDLLGTSEEYLYLAYQDKNGYFFRQNLTSIDKVNKKLTVNTRHFSDWYIERIFRILNLSSGKTLSANEETEFIVYFDDFDANGNLVYSDTKISDANIEGWFVNGPGAVKKSSTIRAIYKAPASIPEAKTVEVGVRVKNLIDKIHPDRPGTAGLVIVQVPVQIVGEEFFTWSIDGTAHTGLSLDGAVLGSTASVLGTGLSGSVHLTLNTNKPGQYELGNPAEADKFNLMVSVSNQLQVIYQGTYYPCNSSTPKYGPGKIKIEEFGSIGGFISGSFTATVYAPSSGCQPTSKQITGTFKVRRKA